MIKVLRWQRERQPRCLGENVKPPHTVTFVSACFYPAQSDADLPTFWTDEQLLALLLQLTQFFFVVKWFWKIWVKWTNFSAVSDSRDTDCKTVPAGVGLWVIPGIVWLKILEVFCLFTNPRALLLFPCCSLKTISSCLVNMHRKAWFWILKE